MFSDFKTKTDLARIGYRLKEKDLSLPEHQEISEAAYENIRTFVTLFYSNEEAVKALILTPIIVNVISTCTENTVSFMKNTSRLMTI